MRNRVHGLLSQSSTHHHLLCWLHWCSAHFLLVLVTFASFAVIIVQKVKTPHLCFSIDWSAEPCNLDIRKLNKKHLTDKKHLRISHNSPVNFHWILMSLADAVIALFGYQKEHQIVHISSSTHSWGWMEERYFAIIVCDNYYACYLNFLFVTNLWSDLLLFVGDRILYPKKGSAITWG